MVIATFKKKICLYLTVLTFLILIVSLHLTNTFLQQFSNLSLYLTILAFLFKTASFVSLSSLKIVTLQFFLRIVSTYLAILHLYPLKVQFVR